MIQDIDTRPPSLFLMPVFYCLVVLSLFIALLNKQWELTFLGSVILGMVFGAKMWSRLSLKNVHTGLSIHTNRMFPGDTLKITVRIENAKILPIWVHWRVTMDSRLQSFMEDRYLSKDAWVRSFQTTHLRFQLPIRRRGVYNIGPFAIHGGDLLGFFSTGQTSPKKYEAIVYPRVKRLKFIALPRHDLFSTPGAKHPVEDPIYLLGTRDYEHRRPAKYIHWKASARLNRLQEKLCEPSAQAKVIITIDLAAFEDRDANHDFEDMLEVAASMAIQFHCRGLGIGFITNGEILGEVSGIWSVGYGSNHLSAILETMARLEMKAKANIKDVLMADIRTTAGVCYAHFSHSRDRETNEVEGIYTFLKLSGAFFFCRPTDDDTTKAEHLPIHYNYLNDICIDDECAEDNDE